MGFWWVLTSRFPQGYNQAKCGGCQHRECYANSCGDRHCPNCLGPRQNVMAAVNPSTGQGVGLIVPHCDKAVFRTFLDAFVAEIPKRRGKRVLLGWVLGGGK